jgi:riboflavin synthase
MFTGIVEEVGKVISAQAGRLVIGASEAIKEVRAGDSVAVNGACLTVTALGADSFFVDVMAETLRRTNLGLLKAGDKVNLERSLALGGRLGGHLVQGHVDDTGKVASVAREDGAMLIRFEASPEIMRYVVEKGFIAVDGVSLTVASRDARSFLVSLVEYSCKHTTLGSRRVGDVVNLEVDIIAKYVEQLSQAQRTGITVDFLKEHGFLVS